MTKLNIYLAEDDADDIFFFKDALNDLMIDVNLVVAENGILLINYLEINDTLPDMIFLDLNMPKKGGIECLKEIKTKDVWKKIKTIIFTTSSNEVHMKMCYELGADLFITKPFDYKVYKNVIQKCMDLVS